SLNVPRYMSWGLYPQQFFAMALALSLAIAFLVLPAHRGTPRTSVPWYDAVFALVGLIAAGYIAVRYPYLINRVFNPPPDAYISGAVICLLLLEGIRRSTGWALVVIVIVFILYALFGDLA